MPVVSVIQDETRALLNDVGATLFTDAVLLPFMKKAYQELQDELTNNGVGDTFEETASPISLTADTKAITSSNGLPADLIFPLTLWERAEGGTDADWIQMIEKPIPPELAESVELVYWEWREGEIKLVGSTANREVKIKYIKQMTISSEATTIPVINCQTFLAARVAAIAALVIGGNTERAGMYQADAQAALNRIVSTLVKRNQSMPTRRTPFRANQ